ncbi:unnamed protein product, partial [Allacma fusca]
PSVAETCFRERAHSVGVDNRGFDREATNNPPASPSSMYSDSYGRELRYITTMNSPTPSPTIPEQEEV